jgi:benzylsuccinate CoA-transferase BbsE subunit/naphthyl-2-methylsuccinate CoA transferase subunit
MKNREEQRLSLAPYRVLDLTDESGVFCTKILAGLGADVIRVEPPDGDPTRHIGPFYHDEPDPEKSLHWFTYNLSKRSVTLNLKCTTGQDLFKRLLSTTDFLVECFRPGYLDELGLGYSQLRSINSRIIHTTITPFGATGPYSQFKGSNLVCLAMSGFLYTIGDSDREPVEAAVPLAYIETGVHASAAIIVALWHRHRTGKGQHIDVSARESIIPQMLSPGTLWKCNGVMPTRGIAGPHMEGRPNNRGVAKCKDGYVLYHPVHASTRQALRELLGTKGGAAELLDKKWDNIFIDGAPMTVEMKDRVDSYFHAFALNHTKDELMVEAQTRRAQVVKEQTVADVVDDPALKERGYFSQVEHPELNDTITYSGSPFKADEMTWQHWRRAPLIGEHNQEIYIGELGLSQQELVTLKEGGVI